LTGYRRHRRPLNAHEHRREYTAHNNRVLHDRCC
jgi:hypothetical protein